ncbi:f-box-like domain-containing protein [Ditylenchus destructor]|nr:f-box-like domain-containing protein [Ditylenchus destructor]
MANDTPNQSVLDYLEKAGHYLQTVRDIMDNSSTTSIQQISTQVVTMNDLGDEELLHVLSQLPVMVDLFRCTRVCRRWNRVIRSTIGKHGFKCTKVMSTTTLGRKVGLSDLLQILRKVGPQVRRLELDGLAVISYTNSFMWEQFRSLLMGMPHLEHLGIQFEIVDSYALLALVLLFPKPQQIKSLHVRQESIVKVKPYGRIQYGTLQKSQYRQLVYFDEYDVDEAESEARKQYLSRDKPEVPLLIKFLRHFSSLKELHLYGFMSRRGITMDFLDWPSGLQVLQIEDGVDVGFPYYRWLLYVDVFARLAECCPHLRELRIIVSSSCFVLKDLLKLIRNLEKLDITFANYEDKKSYEPDYELETGILSIAPNLSFLRINSVGMITRAVIFITYCIVGHNRKARTVLKVFKEG